MPLKFTDKQQAFVQEYLIDLNATQAAIRAGYSKKTANKVGPKLLVNIGIQQAIQAAKDKRANKTTITQNMVIKGLYKEATDSIDGTPASRVAAWNCLGKHTGIYELDNNQKANLKLILKRKPRE